MNIHLKRKVAFHNINLGSSKQEVANIGIVVAPPRDIAYSTASPKRHASPCPCHHKPLSPSHSIKHTSKQKNKLVLTTDEDGSIYFVAYKALQDKYWGYELNKDYLFNGFSILSKEFDYCLQTNKEVLWCSACGAFAEGCGTMALARPCGGRRKVGSRQSANQGGRNGLLQQLRNLEKGLHPCTRALLPPPVPIDPHAEVPAAIRDSYSSQAGRRYHLGTPETLSPTLQPLLARVRQREAASRPVKRRVSRKTSPNDDAASSHRNSLLLHTSPSGSG